MNEELWTSLKAKIAERDQLQAALEHLRADIQQLAATLEQELAQFHEKQEAAPEA